MKANNDFGAFMSLGKANKYTNDNKAHIYFKKAFEIDPSNPDSLSNYLIYEIRKQGNLDPIVKSKSIILNSIERCKNQIKRKTNISKSYFNKALFHLFLSDIQFCLENYLIGLKFNPEEDMITDTLNTLDLLKGVEDQLKELVLINNLLLLYLKFHYKNDKAKDRFTLSSELKMNKFNGPIVILVGATTSQFEKEVGKYKNNVINAFKNFKGTVISGGTIEGICGLAGDLQENYSKSIKTIGYVPKIIPPNVEFDSRYSKICLTNGSDFSAREPINYWINIWSNNIDNKDVKILGIDGGTIAFFEYRLALLLNSKVGILNDSGGETLKLIRDPIWQNLKIGEKKLLKKIKNNINDIEDFILYY